MKTSDTFIYGKYTKYECNFKTARYLNGNLALQIVGAKGSELEGEPICTASVNPGIEIPPAQIAVKNWSENDGMDDFLSKTGIIGELVGKIPSGFVTIPVYALTESGLELFKDEN